MSAPRRILIVANRTAATPLLMEEVSRRARAGPCEFALLVPETAGGATADWTLELAIPVLERAARGRVEGIAGEADPEVAVSRALDEGHFDEVLVSTLPKRVSKWLRRDLPRRIEAMGVPVTVVTAEGRTRAPVPGTVGGNLLG
jgi:hypothetical protein